MKNLYEAIQPLREKYPHLCLSEAVVACLDRNERLEEYCKELREENNKAKELLKLTIVTNYSLHKSCYNCSHFTSDRNCNIGKYLYGIGEKACEWQWEHMDEIIKFLHD